MAYKLETERLMPGGLNLLAPGDAGPEGDSLTLNDWWPGAAGRLEQTPQAVFQYGTIETDSLQKANGHVYSSDYDGVTRRLLRDGASIDSGYDGEPLGMLGYLGYLWVINRWQQRKDDGTTVSDWTIAHPGTVTLEDGGDDGSSLHYPPAGPVVPADNPPLQGALQNQIYKYYVTWQTSLGETKPSPVATITPTGFTTGAIVRIFQPASPPATATGWNIFREVGGIPYRLNHDDVLPLGRMYVDDYGDEIHTQADSQMQELGIILEGDHDPPPDAMVMADSVYNERLLVANSLANPNRIWYTQARQPAFFRGAANPNDGDWVDIGTDSSDGILAITCRPNMAVIYRERSIWRHMGDFGAADARIERAVPDMGICGVRGAVSSTLGDWFVGNLSNPGIYKFNNDWAEKKSGKVEPIFRGKPAADLLPAMGLAWAQNCAIGFINGRVWVGYPTSSNAFPRALVYHTETDRWFSASQGYRAYLDAGDQFFGANVGVFQLEAWYGVSGTNPVYHSLYNDCRLPDHEKTWADLVIDHNTRGIPLDITIRVNKNRGANDSFIIGTLNSSTLTKEVIPLLYPPTYPVTALRGKPIRSFNLAVRLSSPYGNDVGQVPIIIETPILLHYYLEARAGRQFDSDETDHGAQGVKEVDQVEIDIDATAGAASLQVYSDIPGGTMIGRLGSGQTVLATTGRQSMRLVLSATVDGKLLRYTIGGPNNFQVYGLRARVLPIGVHLDGTTSEFWAPQPISVGV